MPYYLALATHLEESDKAKQTRFREGYLKDAGMGFRLAVGLGFGL